MVENNHVDHASCSLGLRGEQQVPLQVFVGTWTCSGTPRVRCPESALAKSSPSRNEVLETGESFFTSGLKPATHRVPVRTRIMMRTDGECACTSATCSLKDRGLCEHLTLVGIESTWWTMAFWGRPGPLRTPPEASQVAKIDPHGPRDM